MSPPSRVPEPPKGEVLTRALLEADGLREMLRRLPDAPPPWTDAQLDASLDAVLPQAQGPDGAWVFGYGSLIWNPCLHVEESLRATLHGRHRALALRTRFGRGTPENPGLLLSLGRGGSCTGLALRIAPERCRAELSLLWRREMIWGSYVPRVFTLKTARGPLRAIAFDANTEHPNWCPPMSLEAQAVMVRAASGFNGSNADYLRNTLRTLQSLGLRDRPLERLLALVDALPAPLPAP